MGVPFQNMRHLDLAQVGSENPILAGTRDHVGEPPNGSNVSDRRTLQRCSTDESWDELHDHGSDAAIKNTQHAGGVGSKATARPQSDDSGPHTFQVRWYSPFCNVHACLRVHEWTLQRCVVSLTVSSTRLHCFTCIASLGGLCANALSFVYM